MVVAAVAAAVVLGVVGVGVGIAAAAVAAGGGVVVVVEVVIQSDFHIGIFVVAWLGSGMDRVWNGYGSGYGSGHAIWAGFHAMAVKEESGVFQV